MSHQLDAGMLSWKQLEQLERFDSAGARVLSLSLNLNLTRQAARSYRIAFKSLVKELSATLTGPNEAISPARRSASPNGSISMSPRRSG